jgi:uncharacterized membrane protein
MRVASAGHAAFAAIMIALGVEGLITGRFTPVWQPVSSGVPARDALVYLCAAISLACGIGLLWERTAALAARVLLTYLVIWLLVFRLSDIVRAPAAFNSWDGCAETAVIVAGAWVLYARFAAGDHGVRIARALYGVALIPFSLAHFLYVTQTAALVPAWLPAHVTLAYATGGTFLAAAVAVLFDVRAQLAAALSALQIGLFTLLVWVPVVAAGSKDTYQWSEFGISSALTAAAWVVADSYRRRDAVDGGSMWLARR